MFFLRDMKSKRNLDASEGIQAIHKKAYEHIRDMPKGARVGIIDDAGGYWGEVYYHPGYDVIVDEYKHLDSKDKTRMIYRLLANGKSGILLEVHKNGKVTFRTPHPVPKIGRK